MNRIKRTCVTITVYLILGCVLLASAPTELPWTRWLRDVDVIMTGLERSVAKKLKTEEERTRFQELFWKARNPDPQSPVNAFQVEFYQRLNHAREFLNGPDSDRGRLYLLLGPPDNRSNFVGSETSVDCELWSYEAKDKPGLPPFMNLVFFKPRNMGDYQLYQPGIHHPKDLLSPQFHDRISGLEQAYRYLKQNSSELAGASLSIIPSEGNLATGLSASSPALLSRIYSLPETEAAAGYVKRFLSPRGTVEVTHSTQAIHGYGYGTVTWNKGMPFVHYALMPDALTFKAGSGGSYTARISLGISIEDLKGRIIYQQSKDIDLNVDAKKKKAIDAQHMVFRDFIPIIPGDFNIVATFINQTTREFFLSEEKVTVSPDRLTPVIGFQVKDIETSSYVPFAADNRVVLTDPRFIFNPKDTLEGIVMTSGENAPEMSLQSLKPPVTTIPITPILLSPKPGMPSVYRFKKPLSEIPATDYRLTISDRRGTVVTRKISMMPFYIEIPKPFGLEKPENGNARDQFVFIQGQEYLANGQIDRAIATFETLPASARNAATLPLMAKAYYQKEDYRRVLELLERDGVKKEYPVLVMLANSALALKAYARALTYLDLLRNYGDTPEINQLMASTHLCLGNREKAAFYYQRTRDLKSETKETNDNKK
ncbi:MAG: GWxTD domain-containing protein [Candidatus Omnitrophota bacterium]